MEAIGIYNLSLFVEQQPFFRELRGDKDPAVAERTLLVFWLIKSSSEHLDKFIVRTSVYLHSYESDVAGYIRKRRCVDRKNLSTPTPR